jgi:hypothetical protein
MNNFINLYLYLNNSYLEENMNNSIYDLTVSKDQLFVPDFRNNKLIVLKLPEGNILSKFDVPMPHGVAVDLNGKIYICTYKQNSIVVIENDISVYKDSIHFDHPVSIAIQDNYTLIANWGEGNSGNLIVSRDDLNSFDQFTEEWLDSKPHAVRINSRYEVLVVYRNYPGLVIYDINGNIIKQIKFSDDFDPLSILEYQSHYLVPNYTDGQIYIFDNSLNDLDHFNCGDYFPTNLSRWNNLLFICEEKANRISSLNLENINNILN